MKGYEEEFKIAYAALLEIEDRTEEAIATLETINNMSSFWHLAQVSLLFSRFNLMVNASDTFACACHCDVLFLVRSTSGSQRRPAMGLRRPKTGASLS